MNNTQGETKGACRELLDAQLLVGLLERGNFFPKGSRMFGVLLEEATMVVSEYQVLSNTIMSAIDDLKSGISIPSESEPCANTPVDKSRRSRMAGVKKCYSPQQIGGLHVIPKRLYDLLIGQERGNGTTINKEIINEIRMFYSNTSITIGELSTLTSITRAMLMKYVKGVKCPHRKIAPNGRIRSLSESDKLAIRGLFYGGRRVWNISLDLDIPEVAVSRYVRDLRKR